MCITIRGGTELENLADESLNLSTLAHLRLDHAELLQLGLSWLDMGEI